MNFVDSPRARSWQRGLQTARKADQHRADFQSRANQWADRIERPAYTPTRVRRLSSTFMKLMYASYGLSYGLKYLWTSPSAQYLVHM